MIGVDTNEAGALKENDIVSTRELGSTYSGLSFIVPLESLIKHIEHHSREQDRDYSQFSHELVTSVHYNYKPAAYNFQSQRFHLKVTSLEQQRIVLVESFALGIYFLSAVMFQLVYFKFQLDLIETVTFKKCLAS